MNLPETILTRAFLGAPPPEEEESRVSFQRRIRQVIQRNISRLETDIKLIEKDAAIALSNANRKAKAGDQGSALQFFKTSVTLRRNAQYVRRVQGTLGLLSSQATMHNSIQQTMKSFSKIAKHLSQTNKSLNLQSVNQTVLEFQRENDILSQKMTQVQDSLNEVAENTSDDLDSSLSVDDEAKDLYERAKDGACLELKNMLSSKNTQNTIPVQASREEAEFLRAAEAASRMPRAPSGNPGN